MFEPLIPADAVPAAANVPFSPRFGDVYHSVDGALAQAHYVFLRGNGLPERWRGKRRFTVLETGFGLGVNFLALWQAWRDDPGRCRRLHMVSIEAHPFTRSALVQWHQGMLPHAMRGQADQLAAQWPRLTPGLHRLEFEDGAVTLTLAFGRAEVVAPRLDVQADAIFLDGFAPTRNPGMWSLEVFRELARCAAADATAATWATAGVVRRALSTVGFQVEKRPGFASKREMTVARRVVEAAPEESGAGGDPGHTVVIGAGVAGAGVAHGLARRGWDVTVIDGASAFAGGALDVKAAPGGQPDAGAGHLAAALTPLVDRDDSVRARLTRAGSMRMAAQCAVLNGRLPDGDAVRDAGTVLVARERLGRTPDAVAGWQEGLAGLRMPVDWLRIIDPHEASALAGQTVSRGGVHLPAGMLIQPPLLCRALLAHAGIRFMSARVSRLEPGAAGWRVLNEAGQEIARAGQVVVASSLDAPRLLAASGLDPAHAMAAAMRGVAGQVTFAHVADLPRGAPRCIVAGEGYVLPESQGRCGFGSTYDHDAVAGLPATVSEEAHWMNLGKARRLLPAIPPGLAPERVLGWAGWRAVLPGRLPLIGMLPHAPGVWLATGYASRGLTWCALAGDIIGAALASEPAIIERDLQDAVIPTRLINAL